MNWLTADYLKNFTESDVFAALSFKNESFHLNGDLNLSVILE